MLAELFKKHGTDKGELGYTPLYEILFRHRRRLINKLLEVGIGTMIPDVHSTMVGFGGDGYQPGASLRVWRDYFPRAHIYGMDVQPDTQFSEDRITTVLGDSTGKTWTPLPATGFDIIIDDGSHDYADQIATLENLFPFLTTGGTYIIEDLTSPEMFENPGKIKEIVGESPFFFVAGQYQLLVIARI